MSKFKVGDILVLSGNHVYENSFWESGKLYKVIKEKNSVCYVNRVDGMLCTWSATHKDDDGNVGFGNISMVATAMTLAPSPQTNTVAKNLLDIATEFTNLAKELL